MKRFETMAVTFEVSADDLSGKETRDALNNLGEQGWEPWHMFTGAAQGAFRVPGTAPNRLWIAVWLKRELP